MPSLKYFRLHKISVDHFDHRSQVCHHLLSANFHVAPAAKYRRSRLAQYLLSSSYFKSSLLIITTNMMSERKALMPVCIAMVFMGR